MKDTEYILVQLDRYLSNKDFVDRCKETERYDEQGNITVFKDGPCVCG